MSMGSLNFDYRLNDHQALLVAVLYHYLRNGITAWFRTFHPWLHKACSWLQCQHHLLIGYDAVLFVAKYLQSIDEHCVCKLALVHHCIVKSIFDEHCRGPQTIISTLPSIWTFVEHCVLAHIHNSNASYSVCDHLNEGGGGSGQGWVRYNVGVLRC